MKTKNEFRIKVTVQYYGNFRGTDNGLGRDYKITRIDGAPSVEVTATMEKPAADYRKAYVGDMINEKQAQELAQRVQFTTLPKKA